MKSIILKLILLAGNMSVTASCSEIERKVDEKWDLLDEKAGRLDSLIDGEINKVHRLDSMINQEIQKAEELDSVLERESQRLDSLLFEE